MFRGDLNGRHLPHFRGWEDKGTESPYTCPVYHCKSNSTSFTFPHKTSIYLDISDIKAQRGHLYSFTEANFRYDTSHTQMIDSTTAFEARKQPSTDMCDPWHQIITSILKGTLRHVAKVTFLGNSDYGVHICLLVNDWRSSKAEEISN